MNPEQSSQEEFFDWLTSHRMKSKIEHLIEMNTIRGAANRNPNCGNEMIARIALGIAIGNLVANLLMMGH